jgi:hypothetical protein
VLVQVLCLLPTVGVCRAEDSVDPYDVLYDVIMTRYGPDGKAYGQNETSPSIFGSSTFPFGDKTYEKLDAALDAFGALPQKEIEAYSDIQRALMQRHLWHVFDATTPYMRMQRDSVTGKPRQVFRNKSYQDRREALRPKIASLIQSLALTKAQILALPDTKAATMKSGGFSRRYYLSDPFKPFLPAELYAKESSWVCIGFDGEPPAPFHSKKLTFRSAFLTFMRLPGGRSETLEYVKTGTRQRGHVEQFPVGTQFAFMEQAFLISDEGALILSPLIVSISMRAYLDVERNFFRKPTQSVAEFVTQPRQLMQGNAVMKALGRRDIRLEAGDVDGFGVAVEPFEKSDGCRRNNMLRTPRLNLCMRCHSSRGVEGVGGHAGLFGVKERSPEELVKSTLTYKRDDFTWNTLSELWQADSAGEETQSGAQADQPKPTFDNNGQTDDQRAADDPYGALYDVIMVRKDSNGNAYATDEVGPLIYGRSKFPFDDVTFPKLTAALERFNALSQTRIEAYGDAKRALLQRHLWTVFDATMPRIHKPPTHLDRRRATQKVLATLIGRVALTKDEILALPDTRAATMKSGGYPQEHDPTDRFKPFLPADLYAKDSSWVCLGKAGNPDTDHATMERLRSAFYQFVRLPDGRQATLEYIKKLNDREAFPIGTQFTLIDQAFLISDQGELVLSPFINSIQLRAYLDVTTTHLEATPRATVCVSEFVMRPRRLMEGKFVMRALGPKDFRFQTIAAGSGGAVDPLESRSAARVQKLTPTLQGCVFCHERSRSGVRSLGDFMFGDRYADKLTFEAGNPARIAQAVAASKRKDKTWKKLQELWPKEFGPEDE